MSTSPRMPAGAAGQSQTLLSRDFLLLFFLVLCANCYMAIYYCFEQWLEEALVPAGWRGLLLGALFGMVLVTRPAATVLLLKADRLLPMLLSMLFSSAVLFSYQFMPQDSPAFVWILLFVRLLQGFCLAVFSSCAVSLLVTCIPPGQSARGFALFSLTTLIPYAVAPSAGELLLPLVGGEPALYALTSALALPCLAIIFVMRDKLHRPEVVLEGSEDFAAYRRKLLRSVTHSGLGLVFLALMTIGLCTQTCINFMKGLCAQTGTSPAVFFCGYTITIMAVRLAGNRFLDRLPRHWVVPAACAAQACALVLISQGPHWLFLPGTILYGTALALVYPLQAAVIYDRSTPDTRSVNSNLMNTMFDCASMCAPLLCGGVLSAGFDYHAVILVGAVSISCSGLFFACDSLRQRRRAAGPAQAGR